MIDLDYIMSNPGGIIAGVPIPVFPTGLSQPGTSTGTITFPTGETLTVTGGS